MNVLEIASFDDRHFDAYAKGLSFLIKLYEQNGFQSNISLERTFFSSRYYGRDLPGQHRLDAQPSLGAYPGGAAFRLPYPRPEGTSQAFHSE
jgi:hypothetical protein